MRSKRNGPTAQRYAQSLLMAAALLVSAGSAEAGDVPRDAPSTVDTQADALKLAKRRAKSKRRSAKPKKRDAPAPQPEPEPEPASSVAPLDRRSGPSRIEFDDRLIQGQTNKANAIYLFERRASELRTLVKKRQHFHQEIDESLD